MKIDTLVNITGANLLNSPYISEITSYTDCAQRAVRGSCYFAFEKEGIKEAVRRGAYAVVFEGDEEITDSEIAWIKVPSLKRAVLDVFRYEKINSEIYYCDEITAEIIEKMNLGKNVAILKNIRDLINSLNIPDIHLLSSKKEFVSLVSNVRHLKATEVELKELNLFKSRFQNIEINLPYVYKDFFSKAVNFFEDLGIKYTLEFKLNRFKPVFVNMFFEEVEYGGSEKVLITGIKNDEFFFLELNYFINNTKHAKTAVLNEKMKGELYKREYNFAMLVDFEIELAKREIQKDLF